MTSTRSYKQIAKLIICMGVSGSGKSTVAKHLAEAFDLEFLEADDFHPKDNIQHMASGKALTDEMRVPWVKALCSQIQSSDKSLVMAFSGLSFRHRQMMRDLARPCQFIHLAGPFDLILERMKKREHFMPPELLRSQFEALDSTDQEPDISPISIDSHLPDILEAAERISKRFLAP